MIGIKNITIGTETLPSTIVFDQKIQYVGSMNDLPDRFHSIEWIDGDHRIVFPGFIDVHTHLGIDEEGVGVEGNDFNETSDPVTPHLRVIDGINSFDEGYHRALKSGVTTVQVLPGSANVIGGQTAVLKVKPDRGIEDQIIQFPAGLKIAFGENPKKFHAKQGATTRMGVAATLRKALWKAANKTPECFEEAELKDVLQKELPVRAHAHRADDILTAIRIAKEFHLKLSIEHTTDGILVMDAIKKSGFDVVIGPTMTSKSKVELRNSTWSTYKAFEEAGIPFCITTDHPVVPIDELITSVRNAIKNGLSEKTAIESITLQAAKHLGIDKQTGSLEVGKDADIVLWTANPFRKFQAQVSKVFIDGEPII